MIIGYLKWLNSTKFQIALLAIGLIYAEIFLCKLDPALAANAIKDLAGYYFVARMFEPVIEKLVNRLPLK